MPAVTATVRHPPLHGCDGNGQCHADCVWVKALAGDPRMAATLAGSVLRPSPMRQCIHLGDPTGDLHACPSCSGHVQVKSFACEVHGLATLERDTQISGIACCNGCPDRQMTPPARETTIDLAQLAGSGHRFNASMIRHRGQMLMAYRVGRGGSQIHVARVNEDLSAGASTYLPLHHAQAPLGQEDPRFFVHAGKLHVGYIGVLGEQGPTSVLYARLSDGLDVEQIFYPDFAKRGAWEKNWTFFSWSGELFAVYSIRPHAVLHVVNDEAFPFAQTTAMLPWSGGSMRGGASPVRVGDEFFHWFHGATETAKGRVYNVGCYAFQARPPFRITRLTPDPILVGDRAPRPADFWADCIFPGGAILAGDRWLVSAGVMDTSISIFELAHKQVLRAMVKAE